MESLQQSISSADSSRITSSDEIKSPAMTTASANSELSSPYDSSMDASFGSRLSASSIYRHSLVPSIPTPLLGGMPGREISPASIDLSRMAGDFDEPPVPAYPADLSMTEFSQHPLARNLDIPPIEKASLGLLLPKELPPRSF
jgi:hypothetical protein